MEIRKHLDLDESMCLAKLGVGGSRAVGRVKLLTLDEFNCLKRRMENKFDVQLCKPR